jgi:hypothetical protein
VHVPEILEMMLQSKEKNVRVPEIQETMFWILTKENANSRNSGKCALHHLHPTKMLSKLFQNFMKPCYCMENNEGK